MSLPPDQNAPRPVGASAVGEGTNPKRRRWLLPLLLALALIILAALLFSQCGSDDDEVTAAPASSTPTAETATQTEEETNSASDTESSTASATDTSSESASSATTAASPAATGAPVAGAAGQIVTTDGGAVVLPLVAADPSGGLGQYMNQPVTATAVAVESVPADEGFWVGSSATDRVFVQLDTSAESPFQVEAGQRVSFTGVVQPSPAGYPQTVGVDAPEGADQLTAQAHHLLVTTSTLTLAE